jgi:hypothetical protein
MAEFVFNGFADKGKILPSHDFELSRSGDKDPRAHSKAFSLLNSIPCPIEAKASVKSEKDMWVGLVIYD